MADRRVATEAMHLWLIEPAAAPSDSRWQDRAIWRQVIVAAPSAIFARIVAERWALPNPPAQIGNESPSAQAGFLDEKLYHVRRAPPELTPDPVPAAGEPRVLGAELLREARRMVES